jgi:hypothetical protein
MVSALRTLDPRIVSILVVQLCGLVMTKYTAAGVAVFPILAVLVRAAILFVRSVRARRLVGNWLFGPLVALLLGLVLTAPLWLKNYVWYGDPFYPVLHEYFSPRPWTPDAPHLYRVYKSEAWGAVGTGAEKLEGTLRALYDYSLAVYNWSYFHKSFPIVGSLFTFGLVALPFLGKVWRIWALVLATHVGIAVWYLLWHHDRYLQPLIPWMAACISAMAIVAWRLGVAARIGVVALAAVQLIWGLDIPFWPNHQMTGRSGIGYAADFFGRAFSLDFTSRTRPFEDMARIGREVPKRSKVLLHHEHVRLGLGVMSAWDWPRFQFGLSYGRLGSSRALHRKLKEFGVTHIAWIPKHVYADDTLASELVFHTYVGQYLKQVRSVSGRSLGALPRTTPPQERAEVFVYGCDTYLPSGLYRLEDLHVSPLIVPGQPFPNFPPPRVPFANDVEALLSRTDRAVVNMACPSPPTLPGFELVANHGMKALYARVRAAGP